MKFYTPDGLPFSDDLLQWHLNNALLEEDYESAAEIRDEINRRKELKKKGINYLSKLKKIIGR